MGKKAVLMILDGWGHGDGSKADAIARAKTPFVDSLYEKYPHSILLTDGENVGLPHGQMGNSEVGHLNIGAGRIVFQDLVRINNAIKDDSISNNPVLKAGLNYAKENNAKLHLMGLVSEGGVHSSQAHLHKLCDMAKDAGLSKVFVHAFTDGRDTDPQSGVGYIENLQQHLDESVGTIASVIGRYYAMDRDRRWERIMVAYDLLVNGEGKKTGDVVEAIRESYADGVTDEFIKPIVNETVGEGGRIEEGDVVICFNFRTDRCREITIALTQCNLSDEGMRTIPLHYITMTNYDSTYTNVHVAYDKEEVRMTIGEVVAANGKKQIRIAETEKYPHVTFFFSGGRELEFQGESRIMIPSPKVATYDLQPEMSALQVTEAIVGELNGGRPDFVCLNFANPDMVGHTGVYRAIVSAVETIDQCAQKVVQAGIDNGYSLVIIADHGNADNAINEDGSPNTQHSLNPVPCIVIDADSETSQVKDGILADVAPTLLQLMGIAQPSEMTGKSLIEN
jgi:2,3-bisphosphoglycerate-independent phosphoglycerate mutase